MKMLEPHSMRVDSDRGPDDGSCVQTGIEHLDFSARCGCEDDQHPHETRCTTSAVIFITQHHVDACTADGLDELGNASGLLCRDCLTRYVQDAELLLRRRCAYGRLQCVTCGAPMSRLSGVVRDARPL